MDNDSSICGICGRVWVANEPHYCTMGVPKDMDNIMQELKEAAENWKASDGFINVTTSVPVVSDLELKIRKEVIKLLSELHDDIFHLLNPCQRECSDEIYGKLITVEERLELLWGDKDE